MKNNRASFLYTFSPIVQSVTPLQNAPFLDQGIKKMNEYIRKCWNTSHVPVHGFHCMHHRKAMYYTYLWLQIPVHIWDGMNK